MTPRIGSLFSGYGGLDLAVQRVYGGEVVWYSEIDKHACTVLAARHPEVPNLGDITAVDWAAVPPIDILTGGYPCQPFSHAGKRAGTNDERHLWPHVRDAIVALRPMVTVLENVDGHRSLGLDVVLGDLADLGLSARWGVVRAADAGAPHGRKRVFIVVTDANGTGLPAYGVTGQVCQAQPGPRSAFVGDSKPAANPDGAGVKRDGRGGARGRGIASAPSVNGPLTHSNRNGHGSQLHARGMGSVEGQAASSASERQRPRGVADTGSHLTATDAEGGRWGAGQGLAEAEAGRVQQGVGDGGGSALADSTGAERRGTQRQHLGAAAGPASESGERAGTDWGKYSPAIRRWESVLGRPAPAPTVLGANGRPRLSPYLVEWMMGLEPGHVTGHGLKPAACLKMLGNGVVPQQAELALRMILGLPATVHHANADVLPTPVASVSTPAPWKPGVDWWLQSRAARNLEAIVTGNTPHMQAAADA